MLMHGMGVPQAGSGFICFSLCLCPSSCFTGDGCFTSSKLLFLNRSLHRVRRQSHTYWADWHRRAVLSPGLGSLCSPLNKTCIWIQIGPELRVKAELFGVWERQSWARTTDTDLPNIDSDLDPHIYLQLSVLCSLCPVVCVQPNGGLPSHPYRYSMTVIKYLILGKQGDGLNVPLCCSLSPESQCHVRLWGAGSRVRSGPVPLSQSRTVAEVPPGFPLQTHFFFFRLVLFLSLLLWFPPDNPMSVFCLFLFFGWSLPQKTLPKLHMPLLPFVPYTRVNYFYEIFWVLFDFHMTVESVQLLFVYYS